MRVYPLLCINYPKENFTWLKMAQKSRKGKLKMIKEKKRRIELSKRELAVLEYLAKGWADAAIATDLGMSLVGVRCAIRRACQKTEAATRCGLVSWGYKNSILN